MFSQSITGIKSNLDAFTQAAARIAQPQTPDVLSGRPDKQSPRATGPQLAIDPADQTAGKPPNKTLPAQAPTKAQKPNSTKETANDPGTRRKASRDTDLARETVNMMVAEKGVQANLSVLRTASSLSGQGLNILA
jgi:hypothetical protein